MDHSKYKDSVKVYGLKSGHAVDYYDGGHRKQQPKVPRNKNPNKIWDGSELVGINAGHR